MPYLTDTTDVLSVKALLINNSQDANIQCQFITGSDATGCMVVLTSERGQEFFNLSRNTKTNSATLRISLKHPPLLYLRVEVFDIEYNGLTGFLSVPGGLEILFNYEPNNPGGY